MTGIRVSQGSHTLACGSLGYPYRNPAPRYDPEPV